MTANSPAAADVLIIGGGIIGCSIAWRLAQAGQRVTVLDRAQPGAEASSAAAGMLAPVGEMLNPRDFADLCGASHGLYPDFVREIEESSGQNAGYRRDGTLLVATNESLEEELSAIRRKQIAEGYTLQPLTAAEAQGRDLGLSPQIRGGLFVPGDHWVDNERLMRALVQACRRASVRFEAGAAVAGFQQNDERITAVVVDNGARFTASTYVLAAGCWSGEVAGGLMPRIPIKPCRGQMLEFEAPRELPFIVRAGMHYLVPRADRRVVIGTTSEYNGFQKTVTANGLVSILEGVSSVMPRVSEFSFQRAWAGLRPDTADHLPLLGYARFSNLLFATGHFRNGILLAPVTAEIISDLILKQSTHRPIDAYSPTRFEEPGGPAA